MQSKALPLTVADLLRKQAVVRRDAPALQDAQGALSFGQLDGWACRIAQALHAGGVGAGDRIAVLAENRREYIGLQLAAAKIGAIVACLNWRLADGEAAHCLGLVSPRLVFVSRRHADVLARIGWADCPVIGLDAEFDGLLEGRSEDDPQQEVDAEQGLVILYTSGTTGLPKGAVISQRAMVARAMCFAADYGIGAEHAYVAWSPLFHMAATDFSLATLMLGGKVVVQDGLDIERLCATIERETIGWLVAMPGMIDLLIEGLKRHRTRPRGVRLVGAMADLVPLQQIAELTGLLGAPYINSFGATETGLAPASGALLAPGVVPTSLAKRESGFCRVRLVDGQVFGGQSRGDDMIHACQARIVSDLQIEIEAAPEPVVLSAEVAQVVPLAPDVVGVDIELPEPLDYLPGQAPGLSEPVTITSYTPQRVELDADLERPGLVVLADVYYPGWTLTIDGAPAPIYRANRLMRAAAVKSGKHHLVYTYKPRSFRVGAQLSIAGLAVLLTLGVWFTRRPVTRSLDAGRTETPATGVPALSRPLLEEAKTVE